MTEHPILFSGPMVNAIFLGKKTQTRRVVRDVSRYSNIGDCSFACPYGVPGDRLWVRETWGYRGGLWNSNDPAWWHHDIEYRADGSKRRIKRPADDDSGIPKYVCRCSKQRDPDTYGPTDEHVEELERYWAQWRPSIFMPRWASRLTLEIQNVRVQRIQQIAREDERAEGADPDEGFDFSRLWDTVRSGERIKRGEGWAQNPWVWALTFAVVGVP